MRVEFEADDADILAAVTPAPEGPLEVGKAVPDEAPDEAPDVTPVDAPDEAPVGDAPVPEGLFPMNPS